MDDWTPDISIPSYEPEDQPIKESFDPTWPWMLKWAYDPNTGRADVWKTEGGSLDGRPYHRAETEKLWGRKPHVYDVQGPELPDSLGVGTYTPAERKLDGTIVAPPEIKVQAYYKHPVPQAVRDRLEEMFPNVIVREASLIGKLGHVKKADEWTPELEADEDDEPIYKWIWNEAEGVLVWQADPLGWPIHAVQIEEQWHRRKTPKDVLGWAVVVGDEVEMETYSRGATPHALQQVKEELAGMFPDKHVVLPGGPQDAFAGDPRLQTREKAAAWAQEHLRDPLEAPDGPSDASPGESGPTTPTSRASLVRSLTERFRASAGTKADKDGAMVALFVPRETGEKLLQKGGEPLEDLHVTLAYFAEKAADRDDWDEVARIVEQVARQHPKLVGKVNGFGVFQNDVDVLWAAPSVPGLAELRDEVATACEDAGFAISQDHGWTPHITLKYDHKGKLPKLHGPIELEFGGITFARGDDHEDFEFTGALVKETVWLGTPILDGDWLPIWSSSYEPTWQGAHRFVTDGKDVVLDPSTDFGRNHDTVHQDLRDRFTSYYPDHEGTASGWVLPTQDDQGYGIFAPTSGWAAENEPQIHEIIGALDKHLGQPTHWINEYKDALNPEVYRSHEDVGSLSQ